VRTVPEVPKGWVPGVFGAGALVLVLATGSGATGSQMPADDTSIRTARARSNAAIAKHDVAAIAAHWMPDIHIVTSTSAQGTGREVNGQRMAEQFTRRPDTIYVRTPATIEVNALWAVASERGEWTGRWTEPDGVVEIGGTYLAQWRKVDGVWLIQAELFVPTHCRGSAYCAKRP
jgi:ketosteroid isomerase-like protein